MKKRYQMRRRIEFRDGGMGIGRIENGKVDSVYESVSDEEEVEDMGEKGPDSEGDALLETVPPNLLFPSYPSSNPSLHMLL
jgi:hypothetical protein